VLTTIFVGGPAGIVISTVSFAGVIGTVAFGTLGVLWVTFAVKGFRAIRRGDVVNHRRWMIRTFALTYAGVMLRLLQVTLAAILTSAFGMAGDVAWGRAYHVVVFLCWVPNLLIAEWFLSRDPASQRSSTSSSQLVSGGHARFAAPPG